MENRFNTFPRVDRMRKRGVYPYFRPLESDQDAEVKLFGNKLLMFGSNSYLGLANHSKVKEAAIAAIRKYGAGCAGSPFLNGTLDIHVQCEEKLARFLGTEAALLFATGMQANLGAITALMTRRADRIYLDKYVHASVVDGARLSAGQVLRFSHNDMISLRRQLALFTGNGSKMIVVDGVYSMHGDIAPLPEIAALGEEFDALVMVDDAHGIGVLGKCGKGTCDYFGVSQRIDIIMGAFSKAFGTIGGFIAGAKGMIDYIKHNARALLFSTSLAPANTAAAMAAIDITESEPERIKQLWENTAQMKNGLVEMGYDLGQTQTPILPVHIGDDMDCFLACKYLEEEGLFVNPVVSPAVASGQALLRVSMMATHSKRQIEYALEKFWKVGKKMGILNTRRSSLSMQQGVQEALVFPEDADKRRQANPHACASE